MAAKAAKAAEVAKKAAAVALAAANAHKTKGSGVRPSGKLTTKWCTFKNGTDTWDFTPLRRGKDTKITTKQDYYRVTTETPFYNTGAKDMSFIYLNMCGNSEAKKCAKESGFIQWQYQHDVEKKNEATCLTLANTEPKQQMAFGRKEIKDFFVSHPSAKFTTGDVDKMMAKLP